MTSFRDWVVGVVGDHPLVVVFFSSLVGNVVPFFPIPYLLVVVALASSPELGGLGLLEIAVVSALGAAIGKFVSYGVGYGASRALPGMMARFVSLRKLLGGSAFLVALLFAATPGPDDLAFIPLGMLRYNPLKTFLALFLGKFVLTLSIAFVARTSGGLLEDALGGGLFASILSAALVIIIAFLMIKVDWEKRLAQHRNGRVRRLARRIRRLFRIQPQMNETP